MRTFTELAKRLPAQRSFAAEVLLLVASTALSNLILALSLPLISRFYSPDQIGAWQLFLSVAMIVGTISSWRYELAIMLPEKEGDAVAILQICLTISLGMSGILLVLILVSQDTCSVFVDPILRPYALLLPIQSLLLGFEQACNYWISRSRDFATLALCRCTRPALLVLTQLVLAICIGGHSSLLIGASLAAQFVVSIILLRCIATTAPRVFSLRPFRECLPLIRTYRSYPLYMAPYSFFTQAGKRIILFLFSMFSGSHVVGLYAMANQLVTLPVSLMSASMNQAFYPRLARKIGSETLEPFVLRSLRVMVLAATPLLVLFIFHGRTMLTLLLGSRWENCGDYAVYLACPSFMLFLTSWLDRVYDVLGRQRLAVLLQVSSDICSVGLLYLTLRITLDPALATLFQATFTSVYNVFWLVITLRIMGFRMKGILNLVTVFAISCAGWSTICELCQWLDPTVRILIIVPTLVANELIVVLYYFREVQG
jgi:O-antigen/teichoic acid export membrane protein